MADRVVRRTWESGAGGGIGSVIGVEKVGNDALQSLENLILGRVLAKVVDGAEFGGLLDGLAGGERGEHDDGALRVEGAEAGESLQSIELGHVDVEQDEVGMFALVKRKGLDAVGGFDDGGRAELAKEQADEFADVSFIISEENFSVEGHGGEEGSGGGKNDAEFAAAPGKIFGRDRAVVALDD